MDRPSDPIEVELISNDGAPEPTEPAVSAAAAVSAVSADGAGHDTPNVATEGPDGELGLLETERGRLVIGAVVAVVVAFVAGWLLGRSSAPDDEALAPVVPTTIAAAEPEPVADVLPAPESEIDTGAEAPVTTRFRPIVAAPATIPEIPVVAGDGVMSVSSVDVDERLADVDVEIVMRAAGRRLLRFDVGSRELTEMNVDRQPFGPPLIAAGDGWMLLPSFDESLDATLVYDDGRVGSADLGVASGLVRIPDTGDFWRSDDDVLAGRRGSIERVGFDGTALGPTMEVPTAPFLADPAGGVIVVVDGAGTFRLTTDDTTKLTDGYLLAISESQLVVYECDDRLRCGYHRVDRDGNARTALSLPDELGPDPLLRAARQSMSRLSPDGGSSIVMWLDIDDDGVVRDVLGVLDLDSGAFTELTADQSASSIEWSPDGGFVFFVDGGRLFAFDRATGERVEVLPEVIGVEAFALRTSGD